ncbi:MAG: hypothetical protein AAF485_03535, partial [Chloroflexota bacterium]
RERERGGERVGGITPESGEGRFRSCLLTNKQGIIFRRRQYICILDSRIKIQKVGLQQGKRGVGITPKRRMVIFIILQRVDLIKIWIVLLLLN